MRGTSFRQSSPAVCIWLCVHRRYHGEQNSFHTWWCRSQTHVHVKQLQSPFGVGGVFSLLNKRLPLKAVKLCVVCNTLTYTDTIPKPEKHGFQKRYNQLSELEIFPSVCVCARTNQSKVWLVRAKWSLSQRLSQITQRLLCITFNLAKLA